MERERGNNDYFSKRKSGKVEKATGVFSKKTRRSPYDMTIKILFHCILLSDGSSLAKGRIQNSLTDTKALRGDFQKLIGIDEVQRLLQAQLLWRNQGEGLICGGGSGVGQMLFLADVQLDILGLGALADDHA